jgi:hypothetical protein
MMIMKTTTTMMIMMIIIIIIIIEFTFLRNLASNVGQKETVKLQ